MQNISKKLLFPIYVIAVSCIVSCGPRRTMNDMIKTTQSGIDSLPWPRQMESLFGEGDHFITHFGFESGPRTWNTVVYFGGRYELALQVEVEINYSKNKVGKVVSSPTFYLWEVGSTIRNSANRVEGANVSKDWKFDEIAWKKLVEAKGDWSAIDIPIKANEPVAGFEDYVKGQRAPVVKIPH